MRLRCALCVGSTKPIAVSRITGDRAEIFGVPYYILCRHALVHRRGQILHSVPGTDLGVAAARPMGKRWLCLCTAMIDDLTQQEGICRQR
jgi:hypothetical protein